MSNQSIRERQYQEYLDEEKKINREVIKRDYARVKLYNSSYKPPNKLEAIVSFNINKYFAHLTESLQTILDDYIHDPDSRNETGDVPKDYNTLVYYIQSFIKQYNLSQRDASQIEDKFDQVLPLIRKIKDIAVAQDFSDRDIVEKIFNNVENRNYQPVEIREFAKQYNNIRAVPKSAQATLSGLVSKAKVAPPPSTPASSSGAPAGVPMVYPIVFNGVPVHPTNNQVLVNPSTNKSFTKTQWNKLKSGDKNTFITTPIPDVIKTPSLIGKLKAPTIPKMPIITNSHGVPLKSDGSPLENPATKGTFTPSEWIALTQPEKDSYSGSGKKYKVARVEDRHSNIMKSKPTLSYNSDRNDDYKVYDDF